MGRPLIQFIDDDDRFACSSCGTDIASHSWMIWEGFMGAQQPAFLFRRSVNIEVDECTRRETLKTGDYTLSDVRCRRCEAYLGWKYLRATNQEQKYKEGTILLQQDHLSLANPSSTPPTHANLCLAASPTSNASGSTQTDATPSQANLLAQRLDSRQPSLSAGRRRMALRDAVAAGGGAREWLPRTPRSPLERSQEEAAGDGQLVMEDDIWEAVSRARAERQQHQISDPVFQGIVSMSMLRPLDMNERQLQIPPVAMNAGPAQGLGSPRSQANDAIAQLHALVQQVFQRAGAHPAREDARRAPRGAGPESHRLMDSTDSQNFNA